MLSCLAILLPLALTLYRCRVLGITETSELERFHKSLIAVPAYTVYIGAKLAFENAALSERAKKTILAAGGTAFGIYLLERILRHRTRFVYDLLAPHMDGMLACLIWVLCAVITGSLLVYLLKKIPFLRKWI